MLSAPASAATHAYPQQLYSARLVAADVDAVTDAVLTASRALVGVAARSLAVVDAEVTLPQYRALVVLAARGPRLVGELADELSIHPSTETRLRRREIATIVERVPAKLWQPTVRALNAFAEAAGELPQQAWTLGWS